MISFGLTKPARTEVVLLSPSGGTAMVVESGRSRPAGLNVVRLPLRRAGGRALAPGVYIVRVRATDSDGRVARATTLLVVR